MKDKLEKFEKRALIQIIRCYDNYVQEWYEDHDEGYPVCLDEFIDNELEFYLRGE